MYLVQTVKLHHHRGEEAMANVLAVINKARDAGTQTTHTNLPPPPNEYFETYRNPRDMKYGECFALSTRTSECEAFRVALLYCRRATSDSKSGRLS